ncbi:MAG: ribonuclease HI [Bacteroidales bacterium]|nr:ribonuclease HI [Bacteroidales bacterium]
MAAEQRPVIRLYTDGSASGNPGPGGFGVVLRCCDLEKEISGGYILTTNNRMELLAVITGLEAIKWDNADVIVTTDSKYVCDSVTKGWVFEWEKKGFAKKKNPDLWVRFLKVYRRHNVRFTWVKGHAGHPENERCDALATAGTALAMSNPATADHDVYFENQKEEWNLLTD